jgi:hypothetical protein
MAVAATQDCSSASFVRWSLGTRSPSLPLMDDDMVWRVPRKLVATRLGRDGCILRCTMRMSQVKTRPEVRSTCTDSHAVQKGGLTFRRIALSPAQSCLGGGGGEAAVVKVSQLCIPSRPPPPLCGAVTLAAEEEEGGNNSIQGVGGGRRVSW